MSDVNMNELKSAVDVVQQTLAETLAIGNKASAEVKNIKDANSELRAEHAKALEDFQGKLEKFEKHLARTPNITSESDVPADNVKQFQYNMKHSTNSAKELDGAQLNQVKDVYDKLMIHGESKAYSLFTDEQKTIANTIVSTEGGYLTAPEYDQNIISKEFESQGVMNLIAIKNIAGNTLSQNIDYADYDKATYINELANGNPDDWEPNYKEVNWTVHDQEWKFSIKRNLVEDALMNVESDIINNGRAGAIRQTSAQILVGNGVNRPRGIFDYEDGTGFDKIKRVESNNSTSIGWKDVITTLPKELLSPYATNAKYAMNRKTFFDLLTDLDGAGQYAIMNQINFFSGANAGMFIMGHEVVFDAFIPTTEIAGNQSVIFGDFAQAYQLVQKSGFTLLQLGLKNARDIEYVMKRRNDGRLRMGDALKIMKVKA